MAWDRSARHLGWLSTVILHALNVFGNPGDTDLSWPQDHALPLFLKAAQTIDAANITLVTAEERLLLVSLQGVVNRHQPRVYLYWNDFDPDDDSGSPAEEVYARRYWLEDLQDVGFELNVLTSDPFEVVTKYQSELSGAVLFDPHVPDTINLATTVAGIHGGVVATADLATRWHLPVLEDFRGKFADKFAVYEYGLAKVYPNVTNRLITAINPRLVYEAPNATWTTLLKANETVQNRTKPSVYPVEIPSSLLRNSSTVYVRFSDAFNDTGNGPSVYHLTATIDGNQTLASFDTAGDEEYLFLYYDDGSTIDATPPEQRDDRTTGVWRFADGTSSWTYKFTVPATSRSLHLAVNMSSEFKVAATTDDPAIFEVNAYLRDYIVANAAPNIWLSPLRPRERGLFQRILAACAPNSVYMGWFLEGDEWAGVTLAADAGVSVLAADSFTSASFQAGLPASGDDPGMAPWNLRSDEQAISSVVDPTPSTFLPWMKPTNSSSPLKKIYINIVWPEGDNLQYCQNRMREMWDDNARGEIPQGWTISPVLRDTAPNILSHYKATATPNDFLITGPNGAGYTYHINWSVSDIGLYLDRSGTYMRDTGLESLVWVYNRINKTDIPCTKIPDIIQGYEDAVGPGLLGIMCNIAQNDADANPFADARLDVNFTDSGLPVSATVGLDDEEQGVERLRNISAAWNSSVPLWLTAAPAAFVLKPANVSNIVRQLGPEFEILRSDVFYMNLRKAHMEGRVGNTGGGVA